MITLQFTFSLTVGYKIIKKFLECHSEAVGTLAALYTRNTRFKSRHDYWLPDRSDHGFPSLLVEHAAIVASSFISQTSDRFLVGSLKGTEYSRDLNARPRSGSDIQKLNIAVAAFIFLSRCNAYTTTYRSSNPRLWKWNEIFSKIERLHIAYPASHTSKTNVKNDVINIHALTVHCLMLPCD